MSFLYTADWHEIGPSEFYRKVELYTMGWSTVDLDNYFLTGSSYGGPLAIIRDDKKFLRVTQNIPVKPIISIFTPSGVPISTIKWDSGTLVKMGWSTSEELLCVQEDGNVLVYNIFGQSKDTVNCLISSGSAGKESSKEKAFEAEIFPSNNGTGVAYQTTKQNFIVVNNYKDPKVRRYPKVPGDGPFTSWAVVAATLDSNGGGRTNSTSIIAARDSSLYSLDINQATQVFPKFSSANSPTGTATGPEGNVIISISVSLNGLSIALLTSTGVLWLGSSDFRVKYCEVSTNKEKFKCTPRQMVWCGNEAVTLAPFDDSPQYPALYLVTRKGQILEFPMDSASAYYLVPEIDCVRVICNSVHEMVQKVPEFSVDIFGIGSTKGSALLLEASKEFTLKSHKADEYIRCIGDLHKAVEQCIEAAGYEFSPITQKMLLRAAQFGKCFIPSFNPDSFVQMCQMLRILNGVKDYKISIPITYTQLEHLTVSVLIDRLVHRRQYSMAIKIAEFLKLRDTQGRSRILAHWACYKVGQSHVEESKLAKEIHLRLQHNEASISYSEIANKALEVGRKKLALNLAHFETRRGVQVPLFLKLGDHNTALEKAVESGDSELIYKVLLELRDNMPLHNFQILIRKHSFAQSLYIKYCENSSPANPEAVRDIYEQEDDNNSLAALFIKESYNERKVESRLASLLSAQEMYKKAKNDFMAQCCEDQHKLLKHQQSLDQKFDNQGTSFIDLSLRDTIKGLLKMKQQKVAESLKTSFRVSDRIYWWIRLETLGEMSDWNELEKISKVKKLPSCGTFEDFVEICIQFGKKQEAKKYLSKVKEDNKIKYHVMAGLFEEAAQIALEQKDAEMNLQIIYSKCLSSGDKSQIDKVKELIDQGQGPSSRGTSRGTGQGTSAAAVTAN